MVAPADILAELPPEARSVYEAALAESAGLAPDVAADFAQRKLRQAGWYKAGEGWRQLGPDVRDKVNLRQAVPQPDGKFLISDVDVFYPNATKGADQQFTVDRNRRIIDNTNRNMAAGGPPPALTKGHPDFRMNRAVGVQVPSMGTPINFRESPKGEGWIRADLTAVDAGLVEEWKAGKFIGLSAGFVADASDTNNRIGHVAVLGAEAQGLAQLPRTEVFSSDCVCFAADAAMFPNVKETPMKQHYAAFSKCHGAMQAAYAAMEAGEPGAAEKVKQAHETYSAARRAFADEAGANPDADADVKLIKEVLAEEGVKPAAETAPVAAAEPVKPEGKEDEMPKETEAKFSAMQTELTGLKSQLDQSDAERKELRLIVALQEGEKRLANFSAYLHGLEEKGHQFSAEIEVDTFKMFADNPKALELQTKRLEATPVKARIPAGNGPTFGAGGMDPIGGEPTDAQIEAIRRRYAPAAANNNFAALGDIGL